MLRRVDFDNVQDDPAVLLVGSNEAFAASQAADAAASQRNYQCAHIGSAEGIQWQAGENG